VLEALSVDSGVVLTELKVDGGMIQNNTLTQFQADILDVPIITPVVTETTALGATYAAGLAVGFWDDLNQLRSRWREGRRWTPNMEDSERHRQIAL
jgi:glycerol kinase